MSLSPGDRIGPHEILSFPGAPDGDKTGDIYQLEGA